MNVRNLLSEILEAVVNHERNKVRTQKPDYYLNQKKQRNQKSACENLSL